MGSAESWYLPAQEYWVPAHEQEHYPRRQGDLFGSLDVFGERWHAALLVHPTCELVKTSVTHVQVVRVRRLSEIATPKQQGQVVAGFSERDLRISIAFAHTFFLAPPPGLEQPLFANFREIATVPKPRLWESGRVAAMSHDARVTLIRRKLYFRYRINLAVDDVRRLEAARIGVDREFAGPRPAWAPAA